MNLISLPLPKLLELSVLVNSEFVTVKTVSVTVMLFTVVLVADDVVSSMSFMNIFSIDSISWPATIMAKCRIELSVPLVVILAIVPPTRVSP